MMAACLAWGEGAGISHPPAAALWRLAGFEQRAAELTVPPGRRRKGPGVVHRSLLLPVDVTRVDGIPVTTPARTLIDIASVCDEEVVEEALDDALRRGLVSIPRLRWRLDQMGRRPGVVMMRALLDARAGSSVPQSVFETRLLRALRRAGLPEPVAQHEIRRGGRLVAVVDFAYPRERLAIEADGYRWHSGRAQWEHDRSRRNDLTLLGWRVVHVTWPDLSRREQAVIESVQEALSGPLVEARAREGGQLLEKPGEKPVRDEQVEGPVA
jgi:very-short-patch-repair endonuclease